MTTNKAKGDGTHTVENCSKLMRTLPGIQTSPYKLTEFRNE